MIDGVTPAHDLDGLLTALDEADAALRALYRLLAEDPDLAAVHDARLKELHARRLELAQQVGFAALTRRRTAPRAEATPEPPAETSPKPAPTIEAAEEPGRASEIASASEADVPLPSEPASDAEVARWKSTVRSTGLGSERLASPSAQAAWPLVLHDLMEMLGPPRSLDTSVGVVEEIEALDGIASDARQEPGRGCRSTRSNPGSRCSSPGRGRSRSCRRQRPRSRTG